MSDPGGTVGAMSELTSLERAVLDFEHQWWQHPGAKDEAITRTFELTPVRYYQLLNGLLDRPEALQQDPPLLNRLRRLREHRRSGRRVA